VCIIPTVYDVCKEQTEMRKDEIFRVDGAGAVGEYNLVTNE
jgi:hypothetical protein